MFPGSVVAVAGVQSILELQHLGVPGVGVGGGAGLVVDVLDDAAANFNSAVHDVLIQIAHEGIQHQQQERKEGDGAQKLPKGGGGFHLPKHHGSYKQLHQLDGNGQNRKSGAEPENAWRVFPGVVHHEADIAPYPVFWFLVHGNPFLSRLS